MNSVAAIVLNRNLPEVTDRLCEHLEQYDAGSVDCYVVEAGSDSDRLSRHATWYADWPEAREHGLRYARGMNFGLAQLWKEGRFAQYDAFLEMMRELDLDVAGDYLVMAATLVGLMWWDRPMDEAMPRAPAPTRAEDAARPPVASPTRRACSATTGSA